MAAMTAQNKSALKAANCPDDCVATLEANHAKLAAMGINWQRLIELATKFGPILWTIISELLKEPTPTPGPTPVQS